MISKLLVCIAILISADIPAEAAKNLLNIHKCIYNNIVMTITKIANKCIYKYDDLYLK